MRPDFMSPSSIVSALAWAFVCSIALYGMVRLVFALFNRVFRKGATIPVRPYHEQEVIQRLEAAWDTWMRLIARADRDDQKYLEDIAASLLKSVEMSGELAEAEEWTEREVQLNRALQFRLDTIEGFLCTIEERTKRKLE